MPSIPLGTQGILSVPFRASLKLNGQFNYVVSFSLASLKLPSKLVAQLAPGLQIIAIEKRYSPNSITQTASNLVFSKLGYEGFTPAATNTLESFIAAFISYLASTTANAVESKINCELVAKEVDDGVISHVFEVKFKKQLIRINNEFTNLTDTFNPMDY